MTNKSKVDSETTNERRITTLQNKMNRRVVITGIGMVTPLGKNCSDTWQALIAGKSGISEITRFDTSHFDVRFAAEISDEYLEETISPNIFEGLTQSSQIFAKTLKGKLTYQAFRESWKQSGWSQESDDEMSKYKIGISIGSEATRPSLQDLAQMNKNPSLVALESLRPEAPTMFLAEMINQQENLRTVSTACTSSSQACGEGMKCIERGLCDIMIVGGVDILVDPIMITGFSKLGALSTRNDEPQKASRPFDVDRDGFVLGEGAGFLILEWEEIALQRGANILGVFSGYGCSCNAYRVTDSPPDGRGAMQSMNAALQDANLLPEQIGYINAHGTSTSMNDASETNGIKRCFGEHWKSVYVSSTKSMMGHLVAACGSVEAIIALLSVVHGIIPPTANLDNIDATCQLCHVPHNPIKNQISHAMTNAFGFGGSNGTLIISKWTSS
jgi:3-oxoacyl-[acyl-carrier-protein] synthase II